MKFQREDKYIDFESIITNLYQFSKKAGECGFDVFPEVGYQKILKDIDLYQKLFDIIPNPIFIGVAGSYSYGTNTESSDVDLRGVFINHPYELLGVSKPKEQYTGSDIQASNLDITIYSYDKIFDLLLSANPSILNIFGVEHNLVLYSKFFYTDNFFDIIHKNMDRFLSKKVIYTYGEYAKSQLNRLVNRTKGLTSDEIYSIRSNECRSIQKMVSDFKGKTPSLIRCDPTIENEEIYLDIDMKHANINEFHNILNSVNSIHRNYMKSKRNENAINRDKLTKHMMMLIMLYMQGMQILKEGVVITRRNPDELELLLDIKNNPNEKYLTNDYKVTEKFEKLRMEFETEFYEAAYATKLPEKPDIDYINDIKSNMILDFLWKQYYHGM